MSTETSGAYEVKRNLILKKLRAKPRAHTKRMHPNSRIDIRVTWDPELTGCDERASQGSH